MTAAYGVRLTSAERRLADLERRLDALDLGGGGARAGRQVRMLALAAGANVYRPPPPWLPRGPARATIRVLGCASRPVGGVQVTVLFQGLQVYRGETTGDGYVTCGVTPGAAYTYTVVAGLGLRAISGSFVATDPLSLTVQLVALPPYQCVFTCAQPVGPPYRFTDPAGSFVLPTLFFTSAGFSSTLVTRTLPQVHAGACGPLGQRLSSSGWTASANRLSINYDTCAATSDGYPVESGTTSGTVGLFGSLVSGIQQVTCRPFAVAWTFVGGNTALYFGVDPATVIMTEDHA